MEPDAAAATREGPTPHPRDKRASTGPSTNHRRPLKNRGQLGARYYDPTIGRFISTDPLQNLADPQQRNPYAYAADNPTTNSDPSGLAIPCDGGCPNQHPKGRKDKKASNNKPLSQNERQRQHVVQCYMSGGLGCPSGTGADGQARTIEQGADLLIAGHWGFTQRSTLDKWRSMLGVAAFALSILYGGPEDLALAGGLKFLGKFLGLVLKGGKAAPRARKAINTVKNAGCAAVNSFTPDTEVLLASGKHKPIGKIRLGDKVLATDPTTGKTKPEPVVALIAGHGPKHLTAVTIDTGGKKGHHTSTITATDQHPFWVVTTRLGQKPSGHWVNAAELPAGARLRTTTRHAVRVLAIRHYVQPQAVDNLTVANLHTYYVEVGVTPVLVHNDGACLGRALRKNGEEPTVANPEAHHIVPKNHGLAKGAREVLERDDIDINSPVNGVWLSHDTHRGTFTHAYVRWINDEIIAADAAGGKSAVLDVLSNTKKALQEIDQNFGNGL